MKTLYVLVQIVIMFGTGQPQGGIKDRPYADQTKVVRSYEKAEDCDAAKHALDAGANVGIDGQALVCVAVNKK